MSVMNSIKPTFDDPFFTSPEVSDDILKNFGMQFSKLNQKPSMEEIHGSKFSLSFDS